MKKRILAILLLATLLLQAPVVALAADTVFMVPEISNTWDPPGMVYKSPALDSLAYKGSGGFVADIINRRSLAEALADLHANVNPSKYKVSILGIYPEGEALTDSILKTIKDAGWKKIEVYYPRFFIGGSPDCAGMTPVIEKTENTAVTDTLKAAGYEKEVAIIKVDGVTMKNPMVILYEPEFKFLRKKTITMYKYIPDIQRFVAGPSVLYDGYDKGFMDMEELDSADGEVNGTYVVATQKLPSDLVIKKEQIQSLRDQLAQEDTQVPEDTQTPEDTQISDDTQTSDGTQVPDDSQNQVQDSDTQIPENTVTDKDGEVKWTFANGATPDNFTPEVQIEVKSDKEVKVDFAYSGKLPEGTTVTIQLPKETTEYKDGTKLYFYYYNPDAKEYEYVSEGSAQSGQVTFDIKHCSEYLITTEKLEKVDIVEKGPDVLPILAVGLVALCVAAGITYFVVKKKSTNQ